MTYDAIVFAHTVQSMLYAIGSFRAKPVRAKEKIWSETELYSIRQMKANGEKHAKIASVLGVTPRQIEHAVSNMRKRGTL